MPRERHIRGPLCRLKLDTYLVLRVTVYTLLGKIYMTGKLHTKSRWHGKSPLAQITQDREMRDFLHWLSQRDQGLPIS